MNAPKQRYLASIRSNTAYPTYRWIIGIIALLGYLLAVLGVLVAVVWGFIVMVATRSYIAGASILVVGWLVATLAFLLVRFWKEAALILVDIGDTVTEANSRTP